MAPEKDVLTVREAADFLHISEVTVYRLLSRGALPGAFRVRGSWRIRCEDLERWGGAKPERRKKKKRTAEEESPVLTLNEVAEMFQVSRITIYRLVWQGQLHAQRIGRLWRVNREEIEKLLHKPHR